MNNRVYDASNLDLRTSLLAGVSVLTLMPLAQAQPQAVDQRPVLEEIIVTAQKREQSLQDVPVAVTAIDSEAIVVNRVENVSDLSALVPSLTVRQGAGGSQIPQYSMRGIYTFGSAVGTDKGISLYIDGVYVQNAAGSLVDLADIERIEVLRGPQGTLFGRNSTGGAVSIITRNPTGEFGIRQELTGGNYNQFRSKTRIDFSQMGPLSLSLSYLYSERDGDTRNLGAGTVWDHGPASGNAYGLLRSPDRLGDKKVKGVFVAANLDLHPDFDLSYKFDHSDTDHTPTAVGTAYLATPATAGYGGVPPSSVPYTFYNASPNPLTPITNKRPKAVNNWYTTESFAKTYGHNLTAHWQLSDDLALKNILAYRKTNLYANNQLDGLGGLVVPGAGIPFVFVASNAGATEKQWSNELQLNLTANHFNLTSGIIYFQNDQETAGIPGEFNTLAGAAITGQGTATPGPFVVPANTGYFLPNVKAKSQALYVQPEIHLHDKVDLVLGYRITKDKKNGTEVVPGSVQPYEPSLGRSSPIRYKDDRSTYLVGLNYKPTQDMLAYIKYATGYISGGQLATITFAPETAKSIEGGLKTELFDRRLRSNVAVYRVKYGAIQQATLGSLTGIPSATDFGQAIVPSADATAYGIEWENTLVPVDRMLLGANVSYMRFKFDQNTIFSGFKYNGGVPGHNEFNRPKWSGNLFAQYDSPEVIGGGYLSARIDGRFISSHLMAFDTSPGNGPDAMEDPLLRRADTAPSRWLVNSRLALRDLDFKGSKIELGLWSKNLFDDKSVIQATNLGFATAVIYQDARTYGLDINVEF
ncbi:outer membrane receptor protein [Steroidobacter denitrificans]|uniref:Outer membrane receptor protein n=1 Tax=Steroidobacter denitrificans TaxID=465721 RepID=A0A127F720_STEDE|nr:TonB-dependent receptor [Steroidobacter denitrificans]AMN46236.1 outer membrane receptor protein [Steroidobacter denitrificans]